METQEDLQQSVIWEDFLALASKVRQQEEMIKIAFNNMEILRKSIQKMSKEKA